MVSGCTKLAKAVVVDLDGTLIRQNSFRLYVRAAMHTRRRTAIAWATLLRKAGLLSHNAYRERCMRLAAISWPIITRMGDAAVYSKAVIAFIEQKRAEGFRIILATAALQGYIRAFWNGENVATQHEATGITFDCRGEAKLRAVCERLGGRLPQYILTDSPADYPLMHAVAAAGGTPILVNPTRQSLRFYNKMMRAINLLRD